MRNDRVRSLLSVPAKACMQLPIPVGAQYGNIAQFNHISGFLLNTAIYRYFGRSLGMFL